MIDLDTLEASAKAATQGPWRERKELDAMMANNEQMAFMQRR